MTYKKPQESKKYRNEHINMLKVIIPQIKGKGNKKMNIDELSIEELNNLFDEKEIDTIH